MERVARIVMWLLFSVMGLALGFFFLLGSGWLFLAPPFVAILMTTLCVAVVTAVLVVGGEVALHEKAPQAPGRMLEAGFVTVLLLFGPLLVWLGDWFRRISPDLWLFWLPIMGIGVLAFLAPAITFGLRRARKMKTRAGG